MESILQLFQLAMIVLPVYGFVSLRKQIRYAGLSKKRAGLRYAGMVFSPMLAYAVAYFLVVGVDQVMDANLVDEDVARSFPLAIVLGMMVWLLSMSVFAIGLYFIKSVKVAMPPEL